MEAIKALKAASAPVNYKSFEELEIGDYIARRFTIVNSQFGPRVRVSIKDFYIFLPERFAEELNEKRIEILNNNLVMLKYMGKDIDNHNRLLIDFEMVQENDKGEIVVITIEELQKKQQEEKRNKKWKTNKTVG